MAYETNILIKPVEGKRIGWEEEYVYYNSIREASRALGITQQSIGLACVGRLKSAGGYLWRYSGRPVQKPDYSRKRAQAQTPASCPAEPVSPMPEAMPETPSRVYKTHKTDCMPDPLAYMKGDKAE